MNSQQFNYYNKQKINDGIEWKQGLACKLAKLVKTLYNIDFLMIVVGSLPALQKKKIKKKSEWSFSVSTVIETMLSLES